MMNYMYMYLHISYIFSFVPLTKRWKKFMKSYSFIILSNIYLFVVRVWHIDLSHSVVHILKILVTYSGPTPFLLYIYVFACVTRRIYTIFCAYICNNASFCGHAVADLLCFTECWTMTRWWSTPTCRWLYC